MPLVLKLFDEKDHKEEVEDPLKELTVNDSKIKKIKERMINKRMKLEKLESEL